MKKLNIGCEADYLPGYVNLDFDKRVKADVYHNLNKFPYPFKDSEFDEILASGVLEHIDDVLKVMKELHRITKNKGKVYIMVPHFSDPTQHAESEHKQKFSYHSFGDPFWNKEFYPLFKVLKRRLSFTRINMPWLNKFLNPILNLAPTYYERLFTGFIQCATVNFILEVRKDKKFFDSMIKKMEFLENKIKIDNLKFIKTA